MKYFAKFFAICLLLGAAPYVQAQGMIKKGACKIAAAGAKDMVIDFYNSGKSDFATFLADQRRKNEKFNQEGINGASSAGETLAIAGLTTFSNSTFNKSIRILGALGFSRTEHFYPNRRRLDEYIILEIEARGYQHCLNYM